MMIIASLALSACGAIPTLPPLDSTVTVWTPQPTSGEVDSSPTAQVVLQTMTPAATEVEETIEPTEIPATATLEPTATQEAIPDPTGTPTEEPTPTPTALPIKLQMPEPYYLQNFTRIDLGCDWMGVAGQVFTSDGKVQKELVIRAGGTINGQAVVEDMTMPLAEQAIDLAYGPGGFELTLANGVADSENEVWIQVFSLAGDPLSDQVYLTTYADCEKNLILLNFVAE